jgi:hypothetical protein
MSTQLLNDYESIRRNRVEYARQWGEYWRSLSLGIHVERPTIKHIKIKQTPGYDKY